jgi:hypothetical protein
MSPAEKLEQVAKTRAAIVEFSRGEIDADRLEARLRVVGWSAAAVAEIVASARKNLNLRASA